MKISIFEYGMWKKIYASRSVSLRGSKTVDCGKDTKVGASGVAGLKGFQGLEGQCKGP